MTTGPDDMNRNRYSPFAVAQIEQARQLIRQHDYVTLHAMLKSGMNVNVPAHDGRFLVHDATLFDADGTSIDLLCRAGADINARWSAYLNWTPAHIAWFAGRADVVEKLRRMGADLSLEDSRGWSACRALPCPITQIEASRKFSSMAELVGHTTERPHFQYETLN